MSWHNGDPGLTENQEKKLKDLRERLKETEPDLVEKEDDHFFLRFLRTRAFNVEESKQLIEQHMGVRRAMKVDTILTDYEPPEVIKKCFPGGYFGEDRQGHPVFYDNFGNLDVKGLYYSVQDEEFERHQLFRGEQMVQLCKEASLRLGKHIETFTMVIDLKNISLRRQYHWAGIKKKINVVTIFVRNYPDTVGKILLINIPAPEVLTLLWNMIRPFIDDNTERRMSFLRGDFRTELQKYISPDQLPKVYGGERCEPDPECTNYINPGQPVPREYYLPHKLESSEGETLCVVVGARSSHTIPFHVDVPDTSITWEFLSVNYDIGYEWYIETSTGKEPVQSEQAAAKRSKSHLKPVRGTFNCHKSGKYVLRLDNTFSWFHSKEVYYCVKMAPPQSEH